MQQQPTSSSSQRTLARDALATLTPGAAQRVHLAQMSVRGTRMQVLGAGLDEPDYMRSRVNIVLSDGAKMCAVEVEGMAVQQLLDGTVWEGDSVKIAALRHATCGGNNDGGTRTVMTVITRFADARAVNRIIGTPSSMDESAVTDPEDILYAARTGQRLLGKASHSVSFGKLDALLFHITPLRSAHFTVQVISTPQRVTVHTTCYTEFHVADGVSVARVRVRPTVRSLLSDSDLTLYALLTFTKYRAIKHAPPQWGYLEVIYGKVTGRLQGLITLRLAPADPSKAITVRGNQGVHRDAFNQQVTKVMAMPPPPPQAQECGKRAHCDSRR